MEIGFDSLDSAGTGATGWKTIGWDRDGLCTTKTSTDVCTRQQGASSSVQEDGDTGIENSFGHNIIPMFAAITGGSKLGAGWIQTNAGGTGIATISLSGQRMDVPIVAAKLVQNGTTATFSAVIPTEQLVAAVQKSAGYISTSLCSGSTLESIKTSIRQASDIGKDGTNAAGSTCDGITIGATLTGVRNEAAPIIDPMPDPCAK